MATWLKHDTSVEVKLGPFVSNADGYTALTDLTISAADVRIAKRGGDWDQKNNTSAAVHEENGWYRVQLDSIDTEVAGPLIMAVNIDGALPVWREFIVLQPVVYDTFIASNNGFPVDPPTVANAVWDEDMDAHSTMGSAGQILSSAYLEAYDLPDAAAIADAVWDEVAAGHQTAGTFGQTLGNSAAEGGFSVAFLTNMLLADTSTIKGHTSNIGDQGEGLTRVADIVWDESTAGHTTSGTFGEQVKTDIDEILNGVNTIYLTLIGTPVPATAAAIADAVWDELISTHTNPGSTAEKLAAIPTGSAPTAATIAAAVWDLSVTGHITLGTFGAYNKTMLDVINLDVVTVKNAVDTEVAAIKGKTDQMVFTTANRLDVQVHGMQADTVTASAVASDAVNEIADGLLDRANGVETGVTPRGALRLAASALAGKVSGAGSTNETFRNAVADSKNRIVNTVDASGNRTAVTTDLT
jgi:hypothetical protein